MSQMLSNKKRNDGNRNGNSSRNNSRNTFKLKFGMSETSPDKYCMPDPHYVSPKAMDVVPSGKLIMKATEMLMGNGREYDLRMEPRHNKAIRGALGQLNRHIGRIIVDLGIGTGVVTKDLLASTLKGNIMERAYSDETKGPIEIFGVDMYPAVLGSAKTTIADQVMTDFLTPMRRNELNVELTGNESGSELEEPLILKLKQNEGAGRPKEILKIKMIHADVLEIGEIDELLGADTVIASYLFYWIPGIENKMQALDLIRTILSSDARNNVNSDKVLISIEENPLIVMRKRLNPGMNITDVPLKHRNEVQTCIKRGRRIANAVELATTFVLPDHRTLMIQEAGFTTLDARSIRIDAFHNVIGIAAKVN